jgi:hypothetical protein
MVHLKPAPWTLKRFSAIAHDILAIAASNFCFHCSTEDSALPVDIEARHL